MIITRSDFLWIGNHVSPSQVNHDIHFIIIIVIIITNVTACIIIAIITNVTVIIFVIMIIIIIEDNQFQRNSNGSDSRGLVIY